MSIKSITDVFIDDVKFVGEYSENDIKIKDYQVVKIGNKEVYFEKKYCTKVNCENLGLTEVIPNVFYTGKLGKYVDWTEVGNNYNKRYHQALNNIKYARTYLDNNNDVISKYVQNPLYVNINKSNLNDQHVINFDQALSINVNIVFRGDAEWSNYEPNKKINVWCNFVIAPKANKFEDHSYLYTDNQGNWFLDSNSNKYINKTKFNNFIKKYSLSYLDKFKQQLNLLYTSMAKLSQIFILNPFGLGAFMKYSPLSDDKKTKEDILKLFITQFYELNDDKTFVLVLVNFQKVINLNNSVFHGAKYDLGINANDIFKSTIDKSKSKSKSNRIIYSVEGDMVDIGHIMKNLYNDFEISISMAGDENGPGNIFEMLPKNTKGGNASSASDENNTRRMEYYDIATVLYLKQGNENIYKKIEKLRNKNTESFDNNITIKLFHEFDMTINKFISWNNLENNRRLIVARNNIKCALRKLKNLNNLKTIVDNIQYFYSQSKEKNVHKNQYFMKMKYNIVIKNKVTNQGDENWTEYDKNINTELFYHYCVAPNIKHYFYKKKYNKNNYLIRYTQQIRLMLKSMAHISTIFVLNPFGMGAFMRKIKTKLKNELIKSNIKIIIDEFNKINSNNIFKLILIGFDDSSSYKTYTNNVNNINLINESIINIRGFDMLDVAIYFKNKYNVLVSVSMAADVFGPGNQFFQLPTYVNHGRENNQYLIQEGQKLFFSDGNSFDIKHNNTQKIYSNNNHYNKFGELVEGDIITTNKQLFNINPKMTTYGWEKINQISYDHYSNKTFNEKTNTNNNMYNNNASNASDENNTRRSIEAIQCIFLLNLVFFQSFEDNKTYEYYSYNIKQVYDKIRNNQVNKDIMSNVPKFNINKIYNIGNEVNFNGNIYQYSSATPYDPNMLYLFHLKRHANHKGDYYISNKSHRLYIYINGQNDHYLKKQYPENWINDVKQYNSRQKYEKFDIVEYNKRFYVLMNKTFTPTKKKKWQPWKPKYLKINNVLDLFSENYDISKKEINVFK